MLDGASLVHSWQQLVPDGFLTGAAPRARMLDGASLVHSWQQLVWRCVGFAQIIPVALAGAARQASMLPAGMGVTTLQSAIT
jgi:hypothetical protein